MSRDTSTSPWARSTPRSGTRTTTAGSASARSTPRSTIRNELPRGLSLDAHLGYSWGDYFEDETLGGGELADYSLGISFAAGHFTLAGKLTATDADGDREVTSGPFTNDARFVLSLETTLPRTSGDD